MKSDIRWHQLHQQGANVDHKLYFRHSNRRRTASTDSIRDLLGETRIAHYEDRFEGPQPTEDADPLLGQGETAEAPNEVEPKSWWKRAWSGLTSAAGAVFSGLRVGVREAVLGAASGVSVSGRRAASIVQKTAYGMARVVEKGAHIATKTVTFVGRHPLVLLPIAVSGLAVTLVTTCRATLALWASQVFQVPRARSFATLLAGLGGVVAWVSGRMEAAYRACREHRLGASLRALGSNIANWCEAVLQQTLGYAIDFVSDLIAMKRGIWEQDRISQAAFLLKTMRAGYLEAGTLRGRHPVDPQIREDEILASVKNAFPHFSLDEREAQYRLKSLLSHGEHRHSQETKNAATLTKALWVLEPKLFVPNSKAFERDISFCHLGPAMRSLRPLVRDTTDLQDMVRTKQLPLLPQHRSRAYAG